jgi:hypothetical protein
LRWICKLVNALWSAKIVRVAFDHILVANFMLKFLVHLSLVYSLKLLDCKLGIIW